MSYYKKSQILSSIAKYNLDSRIGKFLLPLKGSLNYPGERVSNKAGHSSVTIDFREYHYGDNIKDIDWKLSAKTDKTFIKIREGYRKTDFVLYLDDSNSMRAEYNGLFSKFIYSLTITYILATIALKSRDKFYLVWDNKKIIIKTENELIDTLVNIENSKSSTNFLHKNIDTGSNFFLITDGMFEEEKYKKFIKNHNSKNPFTFFIQDQKELTFDFNGRSKFLNTEGDDFILLESQSVKKDYIVCYQNHFLQLTKISKSFGFKVGLFNNSLDPLEQFIKAVV